MNGRGMLLLYVTVAFMPNILGFPRRVRIGGLFDGDKMIQKAFKLSITAVNKNMTEHATGLQLTSETERINENAFQVANIACELLSSRVAGIFGPQSKSTVDYVQSMCDTLDIPHITARWDPEPKRGNVVNLYPHADTLSTVFQDIIKEYQWKEYAILYDDTDGLIRMNRLLKLPNMKTISAMVFRLGGGPNFRKTMQEVKQSGCKNLIIDCTYDILGSVLRQAQQVGILSEQHNVIVTSLDLQTLDLEPYRHSGVNLTGVRLIDPESSTVRHVLQSQYLNWNLTDGSRLKVEPALAYDAVQLFASGYARLRDSANGSVRKLFCNRTEIWGHGFSLSNYMRNNLTDGSRLRVEPALAYDAVQLFASGYARLRDSANGSVRKLFCNRTEIWGHGFSLSNYMRNERVHGLSGEIKFDANGFRSEFQLDIVNLEKQGLRKIGEWRTNEGVYWKPEYKIPGVDEEKSLRGKHFIVLISLTDPYGMLKQSSTITTGNDRYEGFAIDIIQEMSKMLGFNYTFEVQSDNMYGSYNNATGKWNGMLGKIIAREADLAITDLTITSEREDAVDFTTPFMNLGISVLYRQPTTAPPSLLSFLLPYSTEVWLYLIGAYIVVISLLFLIGKLCPVEWTNPYPCIKEPDELETPFTLADTPFLVIGALLKGSTGFAPAGISTRALATAWWFFNLIIGSTYIANLAAALSTKSTVWPFKVAEELANQQRIKYGAKKSGSTLSFFRDASHEPYKIMYNYMMSHSDEVLMEKNEDGVRKVQQENYAYLMESSSIEYIKQRECNVTQIGGLLDAKGYGIAMRKDASYRTDLSGAILRLKENGMMHELQTRWWKEKRGGDKCSEKPEVKVEPLNFEDVGGVFLIMISGVALSWLYAGWTFLWNIRNVAVKHNVSYKEEIIEELKFLARCRTKKLVRRRMKSVETIMRDSVDSE